MMKVNESIQIGNLKLRNRIVMPPMETAHNNADGSVSKEMIDYYEERAKGGAGLIVVQNTAIDDVCSRSAPAQLRLDNIHYIAQMAKLAETIQLHGAKAILQLGHGGRQAHPGSHPTKISVAPSPIASAANGVVPKELTIDEIKTIQLRWAEAAERAMFAGFDGIEFHNAHGYLVGEFLSPTSNTRTDEYGGSFENRMRFPLETLSLIRERVGNDFVVGVRISGEEFLPDGLKVEDMIVYAKALEETGQVNYISVSGATYETWQHMFPPAYWGKGHLLHLAAAIKEEVKTLPIITVGTLDIPTGEKALQEGKADLIALGRGHLADPEIGLKTARGEVEDIRPCIFCNEGCLARILPGKSVRCSVNPRVGREDAWKIVPAVARKKVMVIGGGIAGMEAARVAADRGHEVTLYEKTEKLGGHLNEAAAPDFKIPLQDYLSWATRQINKGKVKLVLGQEVDLALINQESPDVVIVAVGSEYMQLRVGGDLLQADDILLNRVSTGENVVVIGGGTVGCETAMKLAQDGKNVTVVEMLDDVMLDQEGIHKMVLLEMMTEKGVDIRKETQVLTFEGSTLECKTKDDSIVKFEVDSVVNCAGLKARQEMVQKLQTEGQEVHVIGDCAGGHRVYDAVEAAWRVALTL
ncbi:MAG: FAD-dependent oxidoreductase [Bacillota bacterium]|nr:FAD-dependent oxidoreductase [Bacillota bacterium]MDW7678433.1 FAD-dependent oxidoreductase [Bacillota bacterium]